MNIFLLDWIPRVAAEYHCDKHVVKMILETAQLLYTAHRCCGSDVPENAYKLTHKNHPCAKWVRESLTNYLWLASLGWWLCKEYTFRYGKTHKTESHIVWLLTNHPALPFREMTEPALAMPDIYKQANPIEAYRTFYRENKQKERGIVTYKGRTIPSFLE